MNQQEAQEIIATAMSEIVRVTRDSQFDQANRGTLLLMAWRTLVKTLVQKIHSIPWSQSYDDKEAALYASHQEYLIFTTNHMIFSAKKLKKPHPKYEEYVKKRGFPSHDYLFQMTDISLTQFPSDIYNRQHPKSYIRDPLSGFLVVSGIDFSIQFEVTSGWCSLMDHDVLVYYIFPM